MSTSSDKPDMKFTKKQELLRDFPRNVIHNGLEAILCFPIVKTVTLFAEPPFNSRVRFTKIRDGEYRITIGRPNFAEKAFQISQKKKTGKYPLVRTVFLKKISKNKKNCHK